MRRVVSVAGLKEVERALMDLKTAAARSVTRKALREGGEIIARAARANAPVDSGGLRESVDVSGTLSRSQRKGYRKQSDQEVFVGPDARPEAITQEFGTWFHPPQPFMRPAWDSQQNNALKRISDELMVGVARAAARAARKAGKAS